MSNVVNIDGSFGKLRYHMDAMWVGVTRSEVFFFFWGIICSVLKMVKIYLHCLKGFLSLLSKG